MCFSDEWTVQIMSDRSLIVRAKCFKHTVKHPTEVIRWNVISTYVNGSLQFVEGIMNQHQYKEELQSYLLTQIREWYPNNDGIFMHDNAPCKYS